MTVRFTTSPDMLYRAQRELARHIRWMRVAFYGTVFVFPIFMLAMGLFLGSVPFSTWFRYNGWLVIGLPLFFVVGIPLIQRRSSKRLWEATPTLQGELAYSFDPSGIELTSPHSRTQMQWASVVRIVETREFMLLFLNKMSAHFVPISSFSGEDISAFRALAANALGKRAEVHSPVLAT